MRKRYSKHSFGGRHLTVTKTWHARPRGWRIAGMRQAVKAIFGAKTRNSGLTLSPSMKQAKPLASLAARTVAFMRKLLSARGR